MNIKDGVFKPLLSDFAKAAKSGNQISGVEAKKILKKGLASIKEEFEGATSEKGLAAQRNALAKTLKAADRNWKLTSAAYTEAKKILGNDLDGKGGDLAKVEKELRSAIHGDTSSGYGSSGKVGSGYGRVSVRTYG